MKKYKLNKDIKLALNEIELRASQGHRYSGPGLGDLLEEGLSFQKVETMKPVDNAVAEIEDLSNKFNALLQRLRDIGALKTKK